MAVGQAQHEKECIMRYMSLGLALCLALGCERKSLPAPKSQPSKIERPTRIDPLAPKQTVATAPSTPEQAAEPQRQIAAKPTRGRAIGSMSVLELYNKYLENELGADTKYKGQWVELGGRVSKVSKDSQGRYYLGFAIYEPLNGPWVMHVVALLSEKGLKQFANVKVDRGFVFGDTVKFVGKVSGAVKVSGTQDGFQVVIEECESP
jgi:hypothetical protein